MLHTFLVVEFNVCDTGQFLFMGHWCTKRHLHISEVSGRACVMQVDREGRRAPNSTPRSSREMPRTFLMLWFDARSAR
jgi:hypothetical protein